MAVELSVSYTDVNGVSAKNVFAVADAAGGAALLPLLDALSNAKISSAAVATPLDVSALGAAAAANNESAKFKMAITFSGAIPAGGTRRPRVTIQIPAPVGTLINGESGDPTNAAFTALLPYVKTSHGEAVDTVESVNYVR
jgi:hypothetical protein